MSRSTLWAQQNRDRTRETQKRSHQKALFLLTKHKESIGCSICGYCKCGAALDWHHINSETKERRIQVRSYFSKLGEEERSKCILLCSNCHRELHYKERNCEYEKETT